MLTSSPSRFGRQQKSLSVVVADDVGEIRNLVSLWMSEAGCSVTATATGNELVRMMRSQSFDLIITDVLMPDGDGLEVIIEAKHWQPKARLLAISGGGAHLQAEDCLRFAKGLGAHGILLKPFNREQLYAAIDRLGLGSDAGQSDQPGMTGD